MCRLLVLGERLVWGVCVCGFLVVVSVLMLGFFCGFGGFLLSVVGVWVWVGGWFLCFCFLAAGVMRCCGVTGFHTCGGWGGVWGVWRLGLLGWGLYPYPYQLHFASRRLPYMRPAERLGSEYQVGRCRRVAAAAWSD